MLRNVFDDLPRFSLAVTVHAIFVANSWKHVSRSFCIRPLSILIRSERTKQLRSSSMMDNGTNTERARDVLPTVCNENSNGL